MRRGIIVDWKHCTIFHGKSVHHWLILKACCSLMITQDHIFPRVNQEKNMALYIDDLNHLSYSPDFQNPIIVLSDQFNILREQTHFANFEDVKVILSVYCNRILKNR